MNKETDTQLQGLMLKAQAGDREAYSGLLSRVCSEIRPFIAQRVPADSVDDVLQDTLITVHRARGTYDSRYAFSPWLYALTQFRIKDLRRSERRQKRLHETLAHFASTGRSQAYSVDLAEALNALPETQRQIVTLHKIGGYSLQEVASALSISIDAAKTAASRAYKKLRENFEGKTNENPADKTEDTTDAN